MRDLVSAFITGRLDRRGFLKGMTAGGFTIAAAESVLATLAPMVAAQAAGGDVRTVEGTGALLLIEQLKAAGVKHVFYGNGTSSAAMLDAMVGDKDINLILGPEEGIVTAMASGYALASNEPTFVNVHGLVGTANQMLNMFNAKRDGDPLVVSSFNKSTEGTGRDNFEEVDDLVDMTRQFTRWSFEVPMASRVPELLRNAMRISTTPPGGATFLSIPTNVAEAVGKAEIYPRQMFTVPIRTKPDPQLIEQAAQILIEARKPFMLVGLDVHRSDAYDEVLQLAELLGMQVVQGLSPFTDFPTDHPLYVGQSDRAFTPFRSLEGADVLLNMGSPMLYQEGAAPVVSPYWKIIECRTAPNDVARWTGDTVPIVADVKESAGALLEAVKSGMTADARAKAKDRFDKIADFNRKVALTREAMAEERKDQIPIAWEHVAREAQRQLEPDAIITHEFNSAMPRVLPWLDLRPRQERTVRPHAGIRSRLVGRRGGRHQNGEARPADRMPDRRRRLSHGPDRGVVGGAPLRSAGALCRVQQSKLQRYAHAGQRDRPTAARIQARHGQLSGQSRCELRDRGQSVRCQRRHRNASRRNRSGIGARHQRAEGWPAVRDRRRR